MWHTSYFFISMHRNRTSYELRNSFINSYCEHLFSIKFYSVLSTFPGFYHLHLRILQHCLYQLGLCLTSCNRKPNTSGLTTYVYFPKVQGWLQWLHDITHISGSLYLPTLLLLVNGSCPHVCHHMVPSG